MLVSKPLSSTATYGVATCLSSDAVGDLVYFAGPKSGITYNVAKIDNKFLTKMPAVAVITNKLSSTQAVIQFSGETGVYSGLTVGKVYFAGDSGTPVVTVPAPSLPSQRVYCQMVGEPVSTTILKLNFDPSIIVRVG